MGKLNWENDSKRHKERKFVKDEDRRDKEHQRQVEKFLSVQDTESRTKITVQKNNTKNA